MIAEQSESRASHLLNQQYNDLGFIVGERLIILVEAQSTWSENIVIRGLLYVVQTWYKYIKRKELDVYDDEKLSLPEPELYVIYTGEDTKGKAKKEVKQYKDKRKKLLDKQENQCSNRSVDTCGSCPSLPIRRVLKIIYAQSFINLL